MVAASAAVMQCDAVVRHRPIRISRVSSLTETGRIMCELADEAVQVGSPGGHAVRIVLDSAFGRSDDTAQAKKSGRAVSARDVDALTEIIDGCAWGREIHVGPVRSVETL